MVHVYKLQWKNSIKTLSIVANNWMVLIQYAMHINRICISAKVYIAVNPQGFTWVVILIYSPQIDGNFKVIYDLPESSLSHSRLN